MPERALKNSEIRKSMKKLEQRYQKDPNKNCKFLNNLASNYM